MFMLCPCFGYFMSTQASLHHSLVLSGVPSGPPQSRERADASMVKKVLLSILYGGQYVRLRAPSALNVSPDSQMRWCGTYPTSLLFPPTVLDARYETT
ncbi:hypothetical protein BDR03DRAFT_950908 [Suillus americanus]|nr:hypothetical protein BDR03DRAFT_950908 [Suillus americanus]